MEKIKQRVVSVLNWAVDRYLRRNHVTVIAVAGSIGKTSTVNAVRTVLARKYRVHKPKTAYNTNRSVHLELFDLPFASSTAGWVRMVLTILLKSLGTAPYEVAVVEIGTDHPGELRSFAWLKPRIGILTAIAPEHMELFKTLEAVAHEELVVADFCDRLLFNRSAVDGRFVPADLAGRAEWYGEGTDYAASDYYLHGAAASADFRFGSRILPAVPVKVVGPHSLQALAAAAAAAAMLGLSDDEVADGLRAVEPVAGRMRLLSGVDDSTIIDDSYNASPQAAKAALDVLYGLEVPQRIAVLGMMNEMGDYSPQAHREVGAYCDPFKLALVVTIGADANDYLAAEAEARGCRVERFVSPYDAGQSIRRQLQPGAAMLFKGSQNGVFAEEAIKSVLRNPADEAGLVRQSEYWMSRKRLQFGRLLPED